MRLFFVDRLNYEYLKLKKKGKKNPRVKALEAIFVADRLKKTKEKSIIFRSSKLILSLKKRIGGKVPSFGLLKSSEPGWF